MDTRFPPILSQHQIDPRPAARVLVLPSLPWGEWLIAAAVLLALTTL
ncbi:MAG: hypothetical protein IPL38_16510 [Rhodobacter sp.]|jgi:hypothetical protein|nr:hypothetical protein [Rhodobacter sp.]MBK8441029.1 hypothetical protein [Rhodobacter sp.]